MNTTIDLFGADDPVKSLAPFTVSLSDSNSPPKQCNITNYPALQQIKQNRKILQFSIYQITQREHYNPSYLQTRSPKNQQLYNLFFTTKSIQQKKAQFSKQFCQKYKTLTHNESNQQDIYKRVDFKQKILERISQIRDRSITCKMPESNQFNINQTQISFLQPEFKKDDFFTQRPPQSRVNSSFQKCKKICLIKPAGCTLGLNVEKCKIIDRIKTISMSPQEKPYKVKTFKINNVQLRQTVGKSNIQQLNIKKKSSIPLTKWEYSDFEND
ncbi:unnamed protein product (macronuclear) [Paramecium tetraurelia]|uniref:Uncharacterized protein n=1 Tax=Paramecium tetraurelia TaxID=5888 RepID=A0D0D1_PARTE|nr:uncharacterized protein GSPATT00012050001 [Paramecium tetraurelia]CAK76498.1 unnamed protein product [Paramecium tetraurelia]|eukprot:XP_001443895.1 hypothetical protein (macronuclear) [Paramecium tetraurelia strain d4-2]